MSTEPQRRQLAQSFLNGFMLAIAIGLVVLIVAPGTYRALEHSGFFIGTDEFGSGRFGSVVGPNGLSKTVAVSIPLLYLVAVRSGTTSRLYVYVFAALGIASVVLASSWGGAGACCLALALTVSSLVVTMRKSFVSRRLGIVLAVAILLAGVLWLAVLSDVVPSVPAGLTKQFRERIVSVVASGSLSDAGSFEVKVGLAREAFALISHLSLVGIGSGQYVVHSAYRQSVHNTFLLVWSEGGILALVGLLAIVVAPAAYALRRHPVRSNGRAETHALITLVIVFVVNSLTNTSIYPRFIVLPLLVGFALATTNAAGYRQGIA
jgi:hypothetical protein